MEQRAYILNVPFDILREHLFPELEINNLRSLRATCKLFCEYVTNICIFAAAIEQDELIKLQSIQSNTKIESLVIRGSFSKPNTTLIDEDVLIFPPNIKVLSLSYSKSITNKCLSYLPKTITTLNLSSSSIDDNGLKFLSEGLKTLNLAFCGVTSRGVSDLPRSITDLNLYCCNNFKDSSVLHHFTDLKRVHLGDCDLKDLDLPDTIESINLDFQKFITDELIKKLPKNLKDLSAVYLKNVTNKGIEDLPKTLEILNIQGLWCLEDLHVGCLITDEGLAAFAKFPNLKQLQIPHIDGITEEGLKLLPSTLDCVITSIKITQSFPFEIIETD